LALTEGKYKKILQKGGILDIKLQQSLGLLCR